MSDALSARRLVPILGAALLATMVPLPAVNTPKAPPVSIPAKPEAATTAEVTTRDDAAAFRLLRKTEPITKHPEEATHAQLVQAAHDLALANELSPTFELAAWFHADLGTVFYARAKAKQGPERIYLLEKANVQFHLAALTHGIDAGRGAGGTSLSDVMDYEAAGDATASFILYHCGLLEYELGYPSNALSPLNLLLAAAADHGDELRRPEYIQKARALLPEVKAADEKAKEDFLRRLPR
jgi:hypothetical protein